MIYYSDNPSLDKKVVVTHDGQNEYRVNCRKIKGKYYIMNKTCFFVEGSWYRADSGLTVMDHELGKMVLSDKPGLVKGVVSFNKGVPVVGFFTANPYKNCYAFIKEFEQVLPVINDEILIGNNYAEHFSRGEWCSLKSVDIRTLQTPANVVDNTAKGYNIEDNKDEFREKIRLYNEYSPELTKDVKRYGRMLGGTTFGFEIEAAKGFLPINIQNRNGVVVCRDGSLTDETGKPGPEFVTIPLSGVKGLQTISNLSKELSKRTALSLNCSLHIHLGNLPTTRMYLVSLFRLCTKIQNEMFQMFPFYKTNPQGVKKKNYNKKLPILDIMRVPENISKEEFSEYIDDCYKSIFSWLSEGYIPDHNVNRKNKRHPVQQKWNRSSRYYWVNFMNTIFSERNTVEFRLHTPTTNQQKMVNWLFICNAIVRYANTHSHKILLTNDPITISDVLDHYSDNYGSRGNFLSQYLKAYVEERKNVFYEDFLKGDYVSTWDMNCDKDYVFNYNGVTHLF